MNESKCFCHLNGYEVKDARARRNINLVNCKTENNSIINIAMAKQMNAEEILTFNSQSAFVNYITNNPVNVGDIFLITDGVVTAVKIVDSPENLTNEFENVGLSDFLFEDNVLEPNKYYFTDKQEGTQVKLTFFYCSNTAIPKIEIPSSQPKWSGEYDPNKILWAIKLNDCRIQFENSAYYIDNNVVEIGADQTAIVKATQEGNSSNCKFLFMSFKPEQDVLLISDITFSEVLPATPDVIVEYLQ